MEERPRTVIIGGGGTGAALAHDLTSRGFPVTLLDRGELTGGTTGRHHGQLHSGARYAGGDPEIARECMEETRILRRIAPEALEFNGGYFTAVTEEDMAYRETFLEGCGKAGIPVRDVPVREALEQEPGLNPGVRAVLEVPDGTIDAWRLVLPFFAAARRRGADIRPWHEVTGFQEKNGILTSAVAIDWTTGREVSIKGDYFINAGGAWAGRIASLAGRELPLTPAPGTMLAVRGRLCRRVISRLHPPGDGDILVPQRRLTIIGSTQYQTEDPDNSETPLSDRERLQQYAEAMIPSFGEAAFQAAWSAPRPLLGASGNVEEGRKLSRDFDTLIGGNMISVVGGKATVLRAMAEKTADRLCGLAGLEIPCTTRQEVLPGHRDLYQQGSLPNASGTNTAVKGGIQ